MKFKKLLLVVLLFVNFCSFGQVTIVSDGLNGTTTLFTFTNGSYYSGNSAAGDRPATSPFFFEGTESRGVSNAAATLLSNNIVTTGYTSINMTFKLASFSIGSGNGADAGDIVTVEVSPDGGTNWYSTVRVLGNNNAYWSYTSGTGIASTSYDGNATPVDFSPAAGGNRTTDGFSTVSVTNLPVSTNLRFRITLLNNTANERWLVDDFIVSGTLAGIESIATGNWSNPATWTGGNVPDSNESAIIKATHTVTMDNATYATRDASTTTTVELGGILQTGMTYTNNGTTTVNGTFRINAGGFATGNSFVYGAASTLIMNHANSTPYSINGSQAFWPVANPPFNVTVSANSPTRLDMAVGTVAGLLSISSELNINLANSLTVNGIFRINAGGTVTTNGPIYGSASILRYFTAGTHGRGFEWSANGVGTIGVTPGYPNNVEIQNNTTLDYINGASAGTVGNKAIAGNLSIATGSRFEMSSGGVAAGGSLTVAGNVTVAGPTGEMILGSGVNDDLRIGGNFSVTTTAVFNGNNRKVIFTNNSVVQTIAGPSITIPYLVFEPASGNTTVQLITAGTNLTVSAPLGGNAITFNSSGDIFNINNLNLTIGTTGVANTITGGGTFRGSTTSNLTLLGTGSVGTLTFSGTAAQQTLGTFTVNRTSGAIACLLGSDLTVNTALNLTAGIVDVDNRTMTINNATTVSGAGTNSYIIADNAFGGVLRRQYSVTGNFIFPIGDKTGTMEYSPASVNLTAGAGMTAASYIAVSVNDSKHPDMNAPTHFISRYWTVNRVGTINTPIYTFNGTYLTADINGTETSSFSQFWNGTVWSPVGTILSANTATYGGSTILPVLPTANHFSGGLRSQDIIIQQGATNYLAGSTYTFANTPATSFVDVTFTIQNLGNASLTVFANPTVTGSAYSLNPTMPSNVNIPGLSSSTFTIRFTPPTAGTFTGSISIVNNDSDENPYVINFTGNGTGSASSDILNITASESVSFSSTTNGLISTISDGIEVWRFNLRDGGATADADVLPTTMTALTISQNINDAIGNWNESIEDIVLVNLNTNTIIANGVVTTNQIQFNGISVVAADNSSVLLGLRLTLKCPLGTGANDGDDFGFTISSANVTFDPTGSGKATFTRTSANNRNVITVVATQLTFTTQPITTGVGSSMSNVVVSAVDACGNRDTGFTGTVSLSSTGTMTGSPLTIAAVGGIATFTGITHTVVGTDLVLTASATGLTAVGSTLFDISTVTVLYPGDLAVLAVNTSITSGTDQIVFVCFRDLLPGTSLFLTDNGYERQNANQWGGTEGVITITRTGSVLPKGTIITIETTTPNVTNGTHYDVYTCGAIDTNWTKTAVSGGGVGGFNLNNNDDIYFMQGGIWVNDTSHASTYSGNVLYGWTESGWQTTVGTTVTGDTAWSTLYPGMECFNTTAPTGDGFVKFNDPDAVDFSSTNRGKFDWIALINDQTNWSSFANNTSYNAGGFNYKASCTNVFIDTDIYVNGKWSGRKDNNWFNCENWDTLIVPDETVDVQVGSSSFVPHPIVDATAPFANYLNFIAKTRNLTITDKKVEIVGNINNKLEVHGDLLISNTVANSALDMNDGNNLTPDGQLYLYGNWTNNKDNDAFDEGNGTVHFLGTTNQIINAVTPLGTESFYNVNLDNNFNTGISNDLHATGNLILNPTRNLTIDSNGYVNVSNQLNSNGTVTIQNNGQLIQVNDTDTNIGTYSGTTFNVIRNYSAKDEDYVYWSAPTKLFAVNNLPTAYRYEWNPINNNSNGTQGNWVLPTTPNMTFGKGYIARTFNGFSTPTSLPFTFRGQPNNGLISVDISRGNYHGDGITTGLDYTVGANPNPVTVTRWDDNWNLVGNPYPSAINALTFLDEITNPDIEGFVYLWTHQQGLVSSIDPYYYDFGLNYSDVDNYVLYNKMGVSSGSSVFNGKIASGQGFFVLMSDGPASTSGKVYFNNSMRYDTSSSFAPYNNSQFYRNTSTSNNVQEEEKHRLWLDIVSSQGKSNRTLIGYAEDATNEKDRMYDAVTNLDNSLRIVSYLNDENPQEFNIQGRSLPFDMYDTVRLGVSIPSNGNYKIGIGSLDGLFAENQEIYIEDKLLNTIQSIKNQPYAFSSVKGKFTNRFVLRYTNQALGNDDFDRTNQIVAFSNGNLITINSSLENISEVQVFDVLGRQLYQKASVESQEHSFAKDIAQQTIIVKVKLQNGIWVTKKVLVK
ncbi:MAG: T9SS sorting signal type C domain-containing protein [Flavobacterium sp.]|uniref:T9SS sorting signal type C domain-containing protein n=1 Tax=Flavobacterium sp. TaxID=239 RepID=UPI0022BDA0F6|nr:T9SS sorting signal type C domain-containing protein [Flavobacterium sp.]MCZ8329777.1 T9SS sorting signal type C domain-containing protein [Flavobacterium sp.]